MSTALVFSPHFDDESIGPGGTLARHILDGDRVVVVFMTRGDAGSLWPGQPMDGQTSERVRKTEASAALEALGGAEVAYLDLTDGFMRWEAATVREIIRLIWRYKPDFVYAPHGDEVHTDHQATHQMVRDAIPRASWNIFPEPGATAWAVKHVRYYEIWTPISRPNLFIDISAVVERKRAAIDQYVSQLAAVAYTDAALGLNRYRGAMGANVRYAEAFIDASVTTL